MLIGECIRADSRQTGRVLGSVGTGKNRRRVFVYRIEYEKIYGPIPKGRKYMAHHLCKNPWCINPHHIEIVTARQHAKHHKLELGQRPKAKGQPFKSHCPRGHAYTEGSFYKYGSSRQCKECKRLDGIKRKLDKNPVP